MGKTISSKLKEISAMKKYQLDPTEKEMLQDIENDTFHSVDNLAEEIAKDRNMVSRQNKKDQRMSIRISGTDLDQLRAIAMDEGLPYQTLVTSILHKYVQGKLKEV